MLFRGLQRPLPRGAGIPVRTPSKTAQRAIAAFILLQRENGLIFGQPASCLPDLFRTGHSPLAEPGLHLVKKEKSEDVTVKINGVVESASEGSGG